MAKGWQDPILVRAGGCNHETDGDWQRGGWLLGSYDLRLLGRTWRLKRNLAALLLQPHAIVAGRAIGRANPIDVIGCGVATTGIDDIRTHVNKIGRVRTVRESCGGLHYVGVSASRLPGHDPPKRIFHLFLTWKQIVVDFISILLRIGTFRK